jgi:phosphotransferase system  glucose/maltose/N-acetylglucosamine-specific IIC component
MNASMANEPMKMQGSQCWFVCMVQVWVLSRSSRSTIDTQHISTWQTNLWFDSNLEKCSLQTLCMPALMFQWISIIWDHDHHAIFSGTKKVIFDTTNAFLIAGNLVFCWCTSARAVWNDKLPCSTASSSQSVCISGSQFWHVLSSCFYPGNFGCSILT